MIRTISTCDTVEDPGTCELPPIISLMQEQHHGMGRMHFISTHKHGGLESDSQRTCQLDEYAWYGKRSRRLD